MATQQPGGPTAAPNANKISIVTKSEIRYEGILYNINPQDQNITLCNVKSFGTEGRRPGNELAPSPQIHDYIIFRGTDIKDLKVLEQQTGQTDAPTNESKPTQIQQSGEISEQNTQKQPESQDIKMKGDTSDFDFNAMQQNFERFALEHKQTDVSVKDYNPDSFFDDLSTSTAEKTRDTPFDRNAQKKVDKETFGSEYVDTATHRGGRGGRGRGRGSYRGGYNRNYGGGYQQGGQNRNYGGGYQQGGQNRNYGGGYQQGGQNRNYGGGYQQNRNYGGGEQGGQNRNYGGGEQGRKYGGGQGNYGGQGGYGGNQGNRGGHGGNQGGYGGNQGGYGGNQGGYGGNQQGGYGGGNQQGGYGGNNQGSRYYKTYQTVENNQQNE